MLDVKVPPKPATFVSGFAASAVLSLRCQQPETPLPSASVELHLSVTRTHCADSGYNNTAGTPLKLVHSHNSGVLFQFQLYHKSICQNISDKKKKLVKVGLFLLFEGIICSILT